jgi:hypothetical protein
MMLCLRNLSHREPLRAHPQTLDVIEFASWLVEDVNDHIAAVDKNPLSIFVALDRDRAGSTSKQLFDDTIGYSLNLTV